MVLAGAYICIALIVCLCSASCRSPWRIRRRSHCRAEPTVPRLETFASRCHSAMDGASNWVQNLRQSSRLNRIRHGQPSACHTPGTGWATTRTHPRRLTKAAFTVCLMARLMEVCLSSEKWRFLSATVVIPHRLLHPIAHPQKRLGSLASRTRCNDRT
jgi:hypothetical protein